MGILIKTTADKLKKGDIFSFGDKSWDEEQRFHSYQFYINSEKKWVDEYIDGSRICFNYIGFGYAGEVEKAEGRSFQWQHIQNPSQIIVYLQGKHILSESPKHKGELYYNDHNNNRVYVPYRVNAVNMAPLL